LWRGLRPELQALFDRLAIDPHSELFIRHDGITQSGPDPVSETGSAPRPSLSGWQIETLGEGEESQASGMDAFG